MTKVVELSKARRQLAAADTVDDAKEIANVAAAFVKYAKQARLGLEKQNEAAELKLRAERKAGGFLAQLERKERPANLKRGPDGPRGPSGASDFASALERAGISRRDAARLQDLARIPDAAFEGWLAEYRATVELTTRGLLRDLKSLLHRQQIIDKAIHQTRAQELAALGRYGILLADPPWRHDEDTTDPSRQVGRQFPTMSLEEIKALNISSICLDDAVLWLWACAPLLPEAFEVMKVWGFDYKTNYAWDKQLIGMGYWARGEHEHLLVGTRGNPPRPPSSALRGSMIRAKRGRHSEKPSEAHTMIEAYWPEMRKVELFARQQRPGWTVWGNEV